MTQGVYLDKKTISKIRKLYRHDHLTIKELCERFGLARMTIWRILKNK